MPGRARRAGKAGRRRTASGRRSRQEWAGPALGWALTMRDGWMDSGCRSAAGRVQLGERVRLEKGEV